MPRNTITYTYELKFDDEVPYDPLALAEDVISTKLEMLGKDYTITGAKFATTGVLNELTLMVGDSTQWLIQNEPVTKIVDGVEHKVELLDVSTQETGCLVAVDGKSSFIYTGTTETINNVRIGVTDAVAIHAQLQDVDLCEVNLGADKLELKDASKVKVNGKEIDGSNVDLSTATATGWRGFSVEYKPVDPTYIEAGKSWIDPVFGRFKYVYQGLNTDYETIKGDASGVMFELTFKTADNKEMVLPFYYDEVLTAGFFGYGENRDELIYGDDGFGSGICNTFGDGDDVRLCEGMQFIYLDATAGGTNVAHLMELQRVEETSGGELKVTIKDVTYGKTYTQLDTDDGGVADGVVDFDDFTGLSLTFDALDLTSVMVTVEGVMDFTADSITTLNGAGVYVVNANNDGTLAGDITIGMFEDMVGTAVKETVSSLIEYDVNWIAADSEWQVQSPDLSGASASGLKQESEGNKAVSYTHLTLPTKRIV